MLTNLTRIFLSGCCLTLFTNRVTAGESSSEQFISCVDDAAKQAARAQELQSIVQADQDDRKDWEHKTPAEMQEMAGRDRIRRQRIGAIFGEGCFKNPADYNAAALVYQHGDRPDHYFQTFIWAKKSVGLGDANQKRMMALGIDRYLVNSGFKQLFGSQATKPDTCWCLNQIEPSFPEPMRLEYMKASKADQFAWLNELNKGTNCPAVECSKDLKPAPRGTVPGFW